MIALIMALFITPRAAASWSFLSSFIILLPLFYVFVVNFGERFNNNLYRSPGQVRERLDQTKGELRFAAANLGCVAPGDAQFMCYFTLGLATKPQVFFNLCRHLIVPFLNSIALIKVSLAERKRKMYALGSRRTT